MILRTSDVCRVAVVLGIAVLFEFDRVVLGSGHLVVTLKLPDLGGLGFGLVEHAPHVERIFVSGKGWESGVLHRAYHEFVALGVIPIGVGSTDVVPEVIDIRGLVIIVSRCTLEVGRSLVIAAGKVISRFGKRLVDPFDGDFGRLPLDTHGTLVINDGHGGVVVVLNAPKLCGEVCRLKNSSTFLSEARVLNCWDSGEDRRAGFVVGLEADTRLLGVMAGVAVVDVCLDPIESPILKVIVILKRDVLGGPVDVRAFNRAPDDRLILSVGGGKIGLVGGVEQWGLRGGHFLDELHG